MRVRPVLMGSANRYEPKSSKPLTGIEAGTTRTVAQR